MRDTSHFLGGRLKAEIGTDAIFRRLSLLPFAEKFRRNSPRGQKGDAGARSMNLTLEFLMHNP